MNRNLWGRRALAMLVCMGAAAGAVAADKVKVGMLTTLSGPGAALGNEIRDGFQSGAATYGRQARRSAGRGGGGRRPAKADAGRQAVERLLKRDKVDVMTGIVFSNVLLPVMPAILQSGTIYLSTNTGPENYAGAGCNPNFFAVAWQNEDIPAAMGKYAADQGYKRVALIAPDYPGGRESLNGFKRLYKGGLSEEIYTQLGQLDYGVEIISPARQQAGRGVLFLPGGMGVNFIKQFNGAGLGQEIALLAPGFGRRGHHRRRGRADQGLAQHRAMGGGPDNPANRKFVEDFKKTYKRMPTLYASQVTTPPCCWTARCARPAASWTRTRCVRRCAAPISSRCAAISSSTATSIPSRTTTCGSSRQARRQAGEQASGHGADAVPGPVRRILSNGVDSPKRCALPQGAQRIGGAYSARPG